MGTPIYRRRISSDKIVPISSSSISFGEVFVIVGHNTSQLAEKLESSARAFISFSMFNPWEESLANTPLKVLIWDVDGSHSIFILNSFRIKMSLMRTISSRRRPATSPIGHMSTSLSSYWSRRFQPCVCRWSIWLFCLEIAIPLLSLQPTYYCVVLLQLVNNWLINPSNTISFHKAKFFPSNFRIFTHVLDVDAMLCWK